MRESLYIIPKFPSDRGSFHAGEHLRLGALTLWFKGNRHPSDIPGHYLTYDCLVRLVKSHGRTGSIVEFHVFRCGESKPFSFGLEPKNGKYGISVTSGIEVPMEPSLDDFSGPSDQEAPFFDDFSEPFSLEDADTTALLGGKDGKDGKEEKRRRGLLGLLGSRFSRK